MTLLRNLALVAAGGAAGSVLRYALTMAAVALGTPPPIGTLCANALGCLAGGLLLGAVASIRTANDPWRLFLMTGVLGGLTTFSALSMETVQWFRDGRPGTAALNMGGNLALGIACVFAGLALGRALAPA
ncbi:MAG: fluoride efflux transporter CrcB [Phycisphaerales bacterium]